MSSVAESPNRLFWLIILAAFIPFWSVGIEFGVCSKKFWLNLVLTLIIPICGFIHAVYHLVHARYTRVPSRSGYEPVPDNMDPENGAAVPADPVQLPDPADPSGENALNNAHGAISHQFSTRSAPADSAPLTDTNSAATAAFSEDPATKTQSQPPPYTPGDAVPFDNKIQRN